MEQNNNQIVIEFSNLNDALKERLLDQLLDGTSPIVETLTNGCVWLDPRINFPDNIHCTNEDRWGKIKEDMLWLANPETRNLNSNEFWEHFAYETRLAILLYEQAKKHKVVLPRYVKEIIHPRAHPFCF